MNAERNYLALIGDVTQSRRLRGGSAIWSRRVVSSPPGDRPPETLRACRVFSCPRGSSAGGDVRLVAGKRIGLSCPGYGPALLTRDPARKMRAPTGHPAGRSAISLLADRTTPNCYLYRTKPTPLQMVASGFPGPLELETRMTLPCFSPKGSAATSASCPSSWKSHSSMTTTVGV